MEARFVALALEEMARDCRGQDTQVGDVKSRGREARDHRPLDHPARGRRLAARGDARAALERRSESGGDADRNLGREVDVDEPGNAVPSEEARRGTRLPDHAFVDERSGLHVLVRVDSDARHDHCLRADGHFVADRHALVDADMRADVARPAEDRALDERAPADVRRGVDNGARHARALTQGDAVRQHRVRANSGTGRDAAVVADVRRAFDLLELTDLDALAKPDVAADADARNVQAHLFLERVEVRLAELVEIPDVLPVSVHHVAVQRTPHLQQIGKELLREVVRTVARHVLQHLGLHHVDAGVDRVGEDLAPGRLLEEAFDPALLVRHDDAELERVFDRLEPDRHRCALLLVEGDERAQVDVAKRIARDDEERLVELLRGQADRAGRAERRFLDRIADLHPERLPSPK